MNLYNENYLSLENLSVKMQGAKVAVIGAGPTLDLCIDRIKDFDWFFCADVLAPALYKQLPIDKSLYFSVESRAHPYLKCLRNSSIVFYEKANYRNLPRLAHNDVYLFKLINEPGNAPFTLLSPGTVGGVATAFAFHLLNENIIQNVTFLGMDLAYIDFRIYSRVIYLGCQSRLTAFENLELNRVLLKTTEAEFIGEEVIRRSAELSLSASNLQKLISQVDAQKVFSFSPVGPSGVFINPIKNMS